MTYCFNSGVVTLAAVSLVSQETPIGHVWAREWCLLADMFQQHNNVRADSLETHCCPLTCWPSARSAPACATLADSRALAATRADRAPVAATRAKALALSDTVSVWDTGASGRTA